MTGIWAANRSVLERRHPHVLRALATVEPYSASAVETARSGDSILSLAGDDGVVRPLHSRYRPREEARGLLPEEPGPLDTVIFIGAGLGYAPLELVPRLTDENRIVWLEADPRLLRTALEHVDLRPVLDRELTGVLVGVPGSEVRDRLLEDVVALLAAPIHLVAHPPSLQMRGALYRDYRAAVAEFGQVGSVKLRTTFKLTRRTMENQVRNLGAYLVSPGLRPLAGALTGQPVVVVAAGPSLRRNLGALERAVGHVPIIAVSTALRLLLARGIVPDFTALIDYSELSARYFEDIAPHEAPPMVTEMRSSCEAIAAYPGVHLFDNDPLFQRLFDGVTPDKGDLVPTSSVASTAFHFACWLGADPIIFAGLDLSYPGGLLHVPGTAVHNPVWPQTHRFYTLETWELEYYLSIRGRMVKVPAIPDGEVPTEEVLASYIQEFEDTIRGHRGTVIDATEGGARITGTQVERLAAVLDRYQDRTVPDLRARVGAARRELDDEELRARGRERLDELADEVATLTGIYQQMLPLLDEVVERTSRGEAADQQVVRIQELNVRADEHRRAHSFLKAQANTELWQRLRDDRAIDASTTRGVERQHRQALRDRSYVRALAGAGRNMDELLAEARRSVDGISLAPR